MPNRGKHELQKGAAGVLLEAVPLRECQCPLHLQPAVVQAGLGLRRPDVRERINLRLGVVEAFGEFECARTPTRVGVSVFDDIRRCETLAYAIASSWPAGNGSSSSTASSASCSPSSVLPVKNSRRDRDRTASPSPRWSPRLRRHSSALRQRLERVAVQGSPSTWGDRVLDRKPRELVAKGDVRALRAQHP